MAEIGWRIGLERNEGKEGVMGRHRFTRQERIEGTKAALRSRFTPPQLKPSLRRYLEKLRRQARGR
jgi:hypothetical protein